MDILWVHTFNTQQDLLEEQMCLQCVLSFNAELLNFEEIEDTTLGALLSFSFLRFYKVRKWGSFVVRFGERGHKLAIRLYQEETLVSITGNGSEIEVGISPVQVYIRWYRGLPEHQVYLPCGCYGELAKMSGVGLLVWRAWGAVRVPTLRSWTPVRNVLYCGKRMKINTTSAAKYVDHWAQMPMSPLPKESTSDRRNFVFHLDHIFPRTRNGYQNNDRFLGYW
jgi:hypothetical protein